MFDYRFRHFTSVLLLSTLALHTGISHAQTAVKEVHSPVSISQVNWRYLDASSTMSDQHRAALVKRVKSVLGSALSPAQIDELSEQLTQQLRDAGYQLAHVLVTAEDATASSVTGVLQITVLEGKLGQVTLTHNTPMPKLIVTQMLASSLCDTNELADCKGRPITGERIDRAVLMLRELPNTILEVPTFSKGDGLGEANARFVTKAAGDALTISLGGDNYGSPSTGRGRWNFGLDSANLLGGAENFYFNTSISTQALKSYTAGGDVLLNRYGTRLGLGLSQINLSLSGLAGQTVTKGNSSSVYAKQPLIRTIDNSTNAVVSYISGKSHTDYLNGLLSLNNTSSKWVFGMNGQFGDRVNLRDPRLSSNSWSVSATSGKVNLDPSNIATDAAGAQTNGSYSKINYSVFRQQVLMPSGQWTLSGALTGQAAGKNMDSGEKMALGGPTAVRAYPVGELGSDAANIVNIDLKRHFDGVGGGRLSVGLFTDYASGQLLKNNYAASGLTSSANSVSINGSGVGASWGRRVSANQTMSLSTSYARQGGRESTAEIGSGRSRLFVTAQATF